MQKKNLKAQQWRFDEERIRGGGVAMVSRNTGERARNRVSVGVVVVERTPRDGEGRGRARP